MTARAPSAAPAGPITCTPALGARRGHIYLHGCPNPRRRINAREIAWEGKRNSDEACDPGAPCPTTDIAEWEFLACANLGGNPERYLIVVLSAQ